MTDYAVDIRYPDDFYMLDIEESKNAYNKAVEIRNIIIDKLQR